MMKGLGVAVSILTLIVSGFPMPTSASYSDEVPVLISAVKTDGSGASAEYVKLYNPRNEAVDVSGWQVEYSKHTTALDGAMCAGADWSDEVQTKFIVIPAITIVEPNSTISIPLTGMLDDKQGAVRLLETNVSEGQEISVTHDVVGWGTDVLLPRCSESEAALIAEDGLLITRCLSEGVVVDTNNNRTNFHIVAAENYVIPECPEEPTNTKNYCNTVVITEILPSIEGSDEGKEFIEFYNPTNETVDLVGCGIAMSGSSKEYMFPVGTIIPPKSFRAFYDDATNMTLPNTSQTRLLIISQNEEFVQTDYPATIPEDQAWALIDGEWQLTNVVTPGASNTQSTVVVVENQAKGLGPCPAGKFRNPATNRCKAIVLAASALVPCKPGQIRNPETNRCRSLAVTASSLVPCKAGQERNPTTNRCRKIAADSSLKACDEGEKRNPDTNRCRKVQQVLASGASSDDKAVSDAGGTANYMILGLIGASVAGYGAFEYRTDIRNKFAQLKARFFSSGK